MTGHELFELFVGGQATSEEIASMDLSTITRQIEGMRQDDPDNIQMTDKEIAQAILNYAKKSA